MIALLWATLMGASAADAPYRAPDSIPGTEMIGADGAWLRFREGVPFIDTRLPADYEAGRIPGAINLTIMRDPDDHRDRFTRERLLEVVGGTDRPVVVYCNERDCWRTEAAVRRAQEWGFTRVHYFPGGYPEWTRYGYPFE
ncbi:MULTISPECIES: rhodanese-like domain-containing protein [unclassified Thioalkalivibrio]|uniref:rhodanese-like domain-containing protein n=1 Tax=unclassified Thioalkalivibrio TaxID=2621013 RepID=UPI00036D1801|nr:MULTISPECIES: rhodanese-like domain-containing protein [unclassified Thioalkalivibrio]